MRALFCLRIVLATTLLMASCTGVPLAIDGGPLRPGETVLGPAAGKGTGIMLFQLIPIGQNTRFQTAYERALKSVPGATRLADVQIAENWFWAYVLNGYTTTVKGTAVK